MRFYRYTRKAQVALTVLWVLLGVFWIDMFLGRAHRHWGALAWLLVAAVQLVTIWLEYWTVEEDGIAQHSLFYRRYYSASGLKYAGAVHQTKWWSGALKKSIEIDITATGYPRFVSVADRASFLNALRRIAPHAEITA